MATDYMIQPYALRRTSDDEKFGFSLKSEPISPDGVMRHLVISDIVPGGPAERAGLLIGMAVVDINNVPLISGTTADAGRAIALTEPGKPLMMGIKVETKQLPRSFPSLPASMITPVTPAVPLAATPSCPVKTAPVPPPKPSRAKGSLPALSDTATNSETSIIDVSGMIVIDNGAWQTKIGLASQAAPMIFPTIAGRHKLAGVGPLAAAGGAKPFYGSNAMSKKGILKLTYPYERGVVKNWDDMSALWEYAFKDELRTETKDRPVLITEPLFTSKEQREKMAEIMFEKFEFSSLHIALSSLLGMYAAGYTNDTIVVDVGETLTQIIPICHDFNAAFLACQKIPLGGADVSERLSQLLSGGSGHTFTAQDFNLREIKEQLGAVAENANVAEKAENEQNFTLPDGNVIRVGSERLLCTEVLFNPGRLGMTTVKGIPEAVMNAVKKCEGEAPTLLQNIVVCGGSTMFPGFAERLQNEIKDMTPQFLGKALDVKVSSQRNGKLAAWLGGVAVTKSAGFQHQLITRREFSEFGPSAVHAKSAPI